MKVIDLEHHFYPKSLFDHLRERKEPPYYDEASGFIINPGNAALAAGIPAYNPPMLVCDEMMDLGEYRVSRLDYAGVDTGVLSCDPYIELLTDKDEAVKYARLVNDAAAEACKKYPGRFMGTIALPATFVKESIEELERCVKEYGFKIWKTHSNYYSHCLYEDMFDPIIAKCAELGVAIYIHPQTPACEYLNDSGVCFGSAGFGFGVDVMKTTMRLIMKGTLDKYPNLKLILGHMAEFFPYILARVDNRYGVARDMGVDPMIQNKESFTYYFKNKNIMMTTSGIDDEVTVETAIKNVGIDNIMFGTDFPYEDFKHSVDFIKSLHISDEDKEKIFHGNFEKYILNA